LEEKLLRNLATPIVELHNGGPLHEHSNLYLKYEGANPTGTQKDRIAELHVQRAWRMGLDRMTVGTCGNYGAAVVNAAARYGIKVRVYVPSGFHPARLLALGRKFELVRTDGFVEDSIAMSIAASKDEGLYDANPGSVNAELDRLGYSGIAEEIVNQLGRLPECVTVPTGNGTTLVGIYWGFKDMVSRRLIDSVPRVIAVAPSGTNPIIESYLRRTSYADIDSSNVVITEANEPLAGYHSVDGVEALAAVRASKGIAISVEEAEMAHAREVVLKRTGLNVLPCSAAAVAAAWKLPPRQLRGKSIVALVTGRSLS